MIECTHKNMRFNGKSNRHKINRNKTVHNRILVIVYVYSLTVFCQSISIEMFDMFYTKVCWFNCRQWSLNKEILWNQRRLKIAINGCQWPYEGMNTQLQMLAFWFERLGNLILNGKTDEMHSGLSSKANELFASGSLFPIWFRRKFVSANTSECSIKTRLILLKMLKIDEISVRINWLNY